MRQLLISALFSFLLVINLLLWNRYRTARIKLQECKNQIEIQAETVELATSKAADFRLLSDVEYENTKWIQNRMSLVRDTQDFLVRSGEKYIAQVVPGKVTVKEASVKVFVYLPKGESKVNVAFKTNAVSYKTRGYPESAYNWPNQFQLELASDQVHEFEFSMMATEDKYELRIRTTDFERDIPMPPFTNPGISYGPYFAMHHPNTFPGLGGGYRSQMFNVLCDHEFSIREKSEKPSIKYIGIRVWLDSEDPGSIPITYAMANFEKTLGQFWFDKAGNTVPKKLTDLFQPYDGSGRVYFKSQ